MEIYDRLDEMGSEKAEAKAAYILCGLGFTHAMMNKKCKVHCYKQLVLGLTLV